MNLLSALFRSHRALALVKMLTVNAVKASVMHIVDVVPMSHHRVATTFPVLMLMTGVDVTSFKL